MKPNFENYPYTQQLIEEHKLEPFVETIKWHSLSDVDVNDQLHAVLTTFEDLTSSNLTRIRAAKERVDQEFLFIGNNLHVFAKEQGRHELNISDEDVTRLFAKVEIGGTRYLTPDQ